MLAADKLQLQSLMKQQAVSLKEKELNLHHSNCMTVGTQAAVLAGLDITMFIEFTPRTLTEFLNVANGSGSLYTPFLRSVLISSDSADAAALTSEAALQSNNHLFALLYHLLYFTYYSMICGAFCCNVIVVAQTTVLSVLGAGLALRGPDGSMMTATNILYQERALLFRIFGGGLTLTIMSVFVGVWLMFHSWITALSCFGIATFTLYFIYSNYLRVSKLLFFHDHESVDLQDILSQHSQISSQPKRPSASSPSKNRRLARNNYEHGGSRMECDNDDYDDEEDARHYSSENPETESFLTSSSHRQRRSGISHHASSRRRGGGGRPEASMPIV
jgi:hypothetical protein